MNNLPIRLLLHALQQIQTHTTLTKQYILTIARKMLLVIVGILATEHIPQKLIHHIITHRKGITPYD
jgi:hypothetical protein